MGRTWLPVVLSALLAQSSVAKDESRAKEAASEKRDRLLQTYTTSAAEYTIRRDATRREKIELQRGPLYVWTNPSGRRTDGRSMTGGKKLSSSAASARSTTSS
jgi:hypothetical protein